MPGNGIVDAVSVLRRLAEQLFFVFFDLVLSIGYQEKLFVLL